MNMGRPYQWFMRDHISSQTGIPQLVMSFLIVNGSFLALIGALDHSRALAFLEKVFCGFNIHLDLGP